MIMDITQWISQRVSSQCKRYRRKGLRVRYLIPTQFNLRRFECIQKIWYKRNKITGTDRLTERDQRWSSCGCWRCTESCFQYELIEDYLGRNHIVDEKTLLKIKDINDDYSDLHDDDVNRNIFWKIKDLNGRYV